MTLPYPCGPSSWGLMGTGSVTPGLVSLVGVAAFSICSPNRVQLTGPGLDCEMRVGRVCVGRGVGAADEAALASLSLSHLERQRGPVERLVGDLDRGKTGGLGEVGAPDFERLERRLEPFRRGRVEHGQRLRLQHGRGGGRGRVLNDGYFELTGDAWRGVGGGAGGRGTGGRSRRRRAAHPGAGRHPPSSLPLLT